MSEGPIFQRENTEIVKVFNPYQHGYSTYGVILNLPTGRSAEYYRGFAEGYIRMWSILHHYTVWADPNAWEAVFEEGRGLRIRVIARPTSG